MKLHYTRQVEREEAPNFYPNAAGYQSAGGSQMFQCRLPKMRKESIEGKMRSLEIKSPKHERVGGNEVVMKEEGGSETHLVDPNFEKVQESQMHNKDQTKKEETDDEVQISDSDFSGSVRNYKMHCKTRTAKKNTNQERYSLDSSFPGASHTRRKSQMGREETHSLDSSFSGVSQVRRKRQVMNKDIDYKKRDPNSSRYELVGASHMVRTGKQLLGLQKMTTLTNKTVGEFHTLDPSYHGYQLIGDSQMVRFGEQILGLQRLQTTSNNRHAEVSTMCHDLSSLINSLQESAQKIVILTLPPVPKLSFKEEHWTALETYNKYIQTLNNGKTIVVGDIAPLFYSVSVKQCRLNLFELHFAVSPRMKDFIHLNFKGFQLIRNYILDYL